jgi:hypothetical protein
MTTITVSKQRYEELLRKAGIEPISLKDANKVISEKVASIKTTLAEIKEICELSGATVKLEYEFTDDIEKISELNPDWNSSSYNC